MSEPSEPRAIEVNGQWVIGGAKGIDSHIEFPPSEEERIQQISLYHIGFWRVVFVEGLPP